MEQNSSQFNNVHESDYSGFINNGYNLQPRTNASATSDTLSDIKNSTIPPHEIQYNIRVNDELDNNQQQYTTSSANLAAPTYPTDAYTTSSNTMAPTYPAPQYDNLPQYISPSSQCAITSGIMTAPVFSAPQYDNLPQDISNVTPAPQYATTSDTMAVSTYPATQYGSLSLNVAPAPQYNNLSQYVSPAPQLVLQIDFPTMTVYESFDYHIILVPKCPCPSVDSNIFNRQDFSQQS